MNWVTRGILVSSVVLGIAAPASVFATNGYFLIGFGAKSRGMGGVGVAYPQDGLAAAYNPAGMIGVGSRLDIGIEAFMPERAVYHDSNDFPMDHKSKGDIFPIPSMGGVSMISSNMAWGVAVIGAGLGTDYVQEPNKFFNFGGNSTGRVGVQLMQMQILPSLAYKYDDTHTFGGTVVVAAQVFQAKGLEAFGQNGSFDYTTVPEHSTNMGREYSFGYGVRLGWLGKFLEKKLSVGVNYSSRVFMSEFEEYDGLFAEHGDFDIPENYAIGFAFKVSPKVNVALDIQQINYSDIASVGNPGPLASDPNQFWPRPECDPLGDYTPCKLGAPGGMGFGWTDQTVYKIGADYKYSEKTTLRAGYNYGKSPIPEDQVLFNVLAPATVEHHITFGATFILEPGFLAGMFGATDAEVSINYMHAFLNTIKGPTAFPPSGVSVVDGSNASIAMEQDAIGVTYGMKF